MPQKPKQDTEPKVRTPAEQQNDAERRHGTAGESHEGSPGYGQPPEDAREAPLPEQGWGTSKDRDE